MTLKQNHNICIYRKMSQVKMCVNCNEVIISKTNKKNQICLKCFSDKNLFVTASYVQTRNIDPKTLESYECDSKHISKKYRKEIVDELAYERELLKVDAHQSFTYGDLTEAQRLTMIVNLCEEFKLITCDVILDHHVDCFISFGLIVFDSDELFIKYIVRNKNYETAYSHYNRGCINLLKNDYI